MTDRTANYYILRNIWHPEHHPTGFYGSEAEAESAAAPTPSTPETPSGETELMQGLRESHARAQKLPEWTRERSNPVLIQLGIVAPPAAAAPAQAEQEEFDIGVLEMMRETWANSLGKHPQEWPVKILARLDKAIAHVRRLIEQRDDAVQYASDPYQTLLLARELSASLQARLSTAEARVRELEADAKRLDILQWLGNTDKVQWTGDCDIRAYADSYAAAFNQPEDEDEHRL